VGRVKELEDIHAKLLGGQGVSVCAVEGMGGLGKSELARRYAWEYRQEYAARYWFSLRGVVLAQAVVTLASRYLDMPEVMQSETLEAQAEWYWQNWTPTEGKVLVIFDDVTDLASIPRQARPLADRFQILVTTRKRKLSSQFADIPLDVISEAEALELLAKLLGKSRVDREEKAAKAICEYLGCLPLGVELAGRYLQLDEDLRLSDYQQRLTIADESLDLQETEEINAARGVIAAFELSWQELSAGTGKVAMLLGLFAPADIAWGLVEKVAADLIDGGDLREGRKQLNNLYLIKAVDQERTRFTMHSLTRQFLQWKLAQDSDTNRLFRETFVMSLLGISKQIPDSPTRDQIAEVAPAIAHLDMLSREMLDDIPNLEENLFWAFDGIARFYYVQGLHTLAEDPLQRRLIALKEKLGDRHPSVATSLNNLALLYYSQGRYEEAEPLYKQSLEIDKSVYGESHPKIATDLNNLAALYYSQGRYKEAEPLLKQALAMSQELLGDRHPDIANSLNNLAGLYNLQGRYEQAEPLYKQALAMSQELLGDRHPNVANGLNNLAGLYYSQGRYEEAEPLYKLALKLRQELLGDRHPDVANSLNNLALLYYSQGRYGEAEPLYKLALALRQELLGDLHPDVATGLNNLAGLYYSQGRYEAAEPLYQQALALWQELLGDHHPDVATSLNNLAVLRYNQNRYDEAKALLLQALEIRESVLGSNHPNTQSTENSIAYLRTSQGKS
jgi:tetratricopeptide (TPR) repeat protein